MRSPMAKRRPDSPAVGQRIVVFQATEFSQEGDSAEKASPLPERDSIRRAADRRKNRRSPPPSCGSAKDSKRLKLGRAMRP